MADEGYSGTTGSSRFVTKKCPCCNIKLGDVDKLGFATRPFDWWGYLIAIISIVVLCVFIWWGFFRD